MRKLNPAHPLAPVALLVLGLSACSQSAATPELPAPRARQGMHGAPMPMDSAIMRRHMQEADSMMVRVRADVAEMRRLSPDQWPAHMPEHLAVVDSMLAMMQRHMSEQAGGMHAQMGMGDELHRRMIAEMQALRSDVEVLRSAPPDVVRERMPAHLERLEQMLRTMQEMHARMRGM